MKDEEIVEVVFHDSIFPASWLEDGDGFTIDLAREDLDEVD